MRVKLLVFLSFLFLVSCAETSFSGVSPSDSLTQASETVEQEEFDLSQKSSKKLDILILPDTSESMHHHLESFGESFKRSSFRHFRL